MILNEYTNINFEKKFIFKIYEENKLLKKTILIIMDKLADSALNNSDISYQYLLEIQEALKKVTKNLELLDLLKHSITNLNIPSNDDLQIDNYNQNFKKYFYIILENNIYIQNLILKISNYMNFLFINNDLTSTISNINNIKDNLENTNPIDTITPTTNIESLENIIQPESGEILETKTNINSIENLNQQENIETTTNINQPESNETIKTKTNINSIENLDQPEHSENSNYKENVLLISEKDKTVTLPFTLTELKNLLKDSSKYSNIEEIIKDKYTIPISYYKYSSLSRFKEAYSLVKKRSNGSTKEALDLGLEVIFKYDLNPAIITACKNIDEFDVYLSCLDDNMLEDFPYFNIVYEGLPTVC